MSASEKTRREKIVDVGSGAFGTALAAVAALSGRADVTLLCRRQAQMEALRATRVNDTGLPGISLPTNLAFEVDGSVLETATIVLFVMPSQEQAGAARGLAVHLHHRQSIEIGRASAMTDPCHPPGPKLLGPPTIIKPMPRLRIASCIACICSHSSESAATSAKITAP